MWSPHYYWQGGVLPDGQEGQGCSGSGGEPFPHVQVYNGQFQPTSL